MRVELVDFHRYAVGIQGSRNKGRPYQGSLASLEHHAVQGWHLEPDEEQRA